ncbi:hypothetical protein KXS11_08965 [Plantibacter flavus]|uniref:hypothetical protein n=1 Tax=Plantibacter flavus TaxID=150123 RepID=UPI003F136726
MRRRITTALGALVLLAALTGCTGTGQNATTFADLDREQTSKDQLTADELGDGGGRFEIDPDSTRLVAVQGDTEIFLAAATEQGHDRICLIVFGAQGPFQSCGADDITMGDSVDSYRVLSDAVVDTALDPDEGWTRLSDNVFTRPVVAGE